MTEAVKVRGVFIGSGRPKICVPIVAATRQELVSQAEKLRDVPFDLVEWRRLVRGWNLPREGNPGPQGSQKQPGQCPAAIYLPWKTGGRRAGTGCKGISGTDPSGGSIRNSGSGRSGAVYRSESRTGAVYRRDPPDKTTGRNDYYVQP